MDIEPKVISGMETHVKEVWKGPQYGELSNRELGKIFKLSVYDVTTIRKYLLKRVKVSHRVGSIDWEGGGDLV